MIEFIIVIYIRQGFVILEIPWDLIYNILLIVSSLILYNKNLKDFLLWLLP